MLSPRYELTDTYFEAADDLRADVPICAEARIVSCANHLNSLGIGWDDLFDIADIALKDLIQTHEALERI